MTFDEQADRDRREALREARFEAFVRRQQEAQRAEQEARERVCELRLRERRAPQLEFSI